MKPQAGSELSIAMEIPALSAGFHEEHWDDILAIIISIPLAWSLLFFWKKPEPGFDQLFVSPQRLLALTDENEMEEDIRDISLKMKAMVEHILVCLS